MGSRPVVCQLRASDETLIERVRRREIGSDRDWHEVRALELARFLERDAPTDFVIDTDGRSVLEIAEDIVPRVAWEKGDRVSAGGRDYDKSARS